MGKPRITAETQVLLCAVSASFLTPFIGSAITVALPAIGRHYAMNALSLSWVALSYMIASAVFLVPFGRLADIHGKERFFFAGIVISTIASALCTAAWSGPSLIALRFVQGVGAAMIFATSTALLTSAYPVSQHGRVLGISTASVFIGLSAGPVAGGLLTGAFGWRSVFVPMALIGCLTAVIGFDFFSSGVGARCKIDLIRQVSRNWLHRDVYLLFALAAAWATHLWLDPSPSPSDDTLEPSTLSGLTRPQTRISGTRWRITVKGTATALAMSGKTLIS